MISGPQDACALDCTLVLPPNRIAYLSSLCWESIYIPFWCPPPPAEFRTVNYKLFKYCPK